MKKIALEWEKLFLEYTDRITIGSDTWVNSQWDIYEAIIAFDRSWLAQLPEKVARLSLLKTQSDCLSASQNQSTYFVTSHR